MLTDAQKTAFDSEGYLVVDDVFEVDAIRAEYAARIAVAPHIPIHRWDSSAPYCA